MECHGMPDVMLSLLKRFFVNPNLFVDERPHRWRQEHQQLSNLSQHATKSRIVVKRVCGGGDDACGGASGGGGGHHHHLFHSFEFGSCAVQGGMSGDLQLQCSFQTSKFSDRKLFPCRKSWELFNDWLQTQNSQNLRAPTEK